MSKKKSPKESFSSKSAEELQKFIGEARKKIEDLTMSLSAKNPSEKRSLRRSVARALTALAQK
jgi:ribosomal protein L29